MTVNTNINTATLNTSAKIAKKVQAKTAETTRETVPVKGDGVDIKKGYDNNEIPSDDDGPGAGGGYEPTQDPAESDGPGAGGGYNSHDIPSDDDGPGAGGGYEPSQDPAESDGPGAGGGYFQISNFTGPLTSFVTNAVNMKWTSLMPEFPLSWTGNALFLEAQSEKKAEEKKPGESQSK